jgi:hypothetical protein
MFPLFVQLVSHKENRETVKHITILEAKSLEFSQEFQQITSIRQHVFRRVSYFKSHSKGVPVLDSKLMFKSGESINKLHVLMQKCTCQWMFLSFRLENVQCTETSQKQEENHKKGRSQLSR